MPLKLQLKLTSNSGELLHVVTCHAGRISVFRAVSPSDLRPYQRALSGAEAKDNLLVTLDGSDFQHDKHIVIGFGEPSPTLGLSVKDYLLRSGVSDIAINTLLLSIGLESIADKHCSELSPDQEARLRLAASTADPEKVVILNDPFEHLSNQWRERAAELLANFARSRNAIIVIPCLTYRPECWIDNQIIERIEVGQTSQRTIGFGSAGSQSNAEIHDLRERLRNDPQFAGKMGEADTTSRRAAPLALAAALSGGIKSTDITDSATKATKTSFPSLASIGAVVGTASIAGFLAFTFTHGPRLEKHVPTVETVPLEPKVVETQPKPPTENAVDPNPQSQAQGPARANIKPVTVNVPAENRGEYILDLYPVEIKNSIIDTMQGTYRLAPEDERAQAEAAERAAQQRNNNLFSLLQRAEPEKLGPNAPNNFHDSVQNNRDESYAEEEQVEADPAAEEARREEIRARFLAAIREAAERRQQENEELG